MESTTQTLEQYPPQSAASFIEQVRRKTRKKFVAEEKIRIVLEGMKREVAISDLCRREGISTAIYYSWVKNFMEAGKSRLKGDSLREANRQEVTEIKRENERLKILLSEQLLELSLFKKSAGE